MFNVSYALDMIQYALPPQLQSIPMSTLIDELMVNLSATLSPEYIGVDMQAVIGSFTDQLMENITALTVSNGILPVGFEYLPLENLLNDRIAELITTWDTMVVPQWTTVKTMLTTIPSVGFRIQVNGIGTEIESYIGGPRGVPLELEFFVSLDFKNWTSLTDIFMPSSTLAYSQLSEPSGWLDVLTGIYDFYIVNPATYSNQTRAFAEQASLSGGLLMASNYNWEALDTSYSIQVGGNPNGIRGTASWNTVGVLSQASVEANGVTVVKISLIGAEDEIPGYEVAIVLTLAPITVIGLIYFMKKKNRIKTLK
jgi:hypothetical protein